MRSGGWTCMAAWGHGTHRWSEALATCSAIVYSVSQSLMDRTGTPVPEYYSRWLHVADAFQFSDCTLYCESMGF